MRARPQTLARARDLRRRSTLPEGLLWRELKGRKGDLIFHRQHALEPYVLDFYCPAARLCVEVDGAIHDWTLDRDARRDAWLAERGIATLRVPAKHVLADPAAVAEQVREAARRRLADLSSGAGVALL